MDNACPVDVPRALTGALFCHPRALNTLLDETGIAPTQAIRWAREIGLPSKDVRIAGWLAVGRRPGDHTLLLELAESYLRSGDHAEALPLLRWAYNAWLDGGGFVGPHTGDGMLLLAQQGVCLYHLAQEDEARRCWLLALNQVRTPEELSFLLRVIEGSGAQHDRALIAEQAELRELGAPQLQTLEEKAVPRRGGHILAHPEREHTVVERAVAVFADVANLDMVCREQYGYGYRLDYGQLLQSTQACGPFKVRLAFVPEIPQTRAVRAHLLASGFEVDLLRPKRSHGRRVANADTAMAAYAVRWAGDPEVGRIELWTGDGDFLRVREAITQAWPEVDVAFRSFEAGTATGIRLLGEDWEPIDPAYLLWEEQLAFRYRG